MSQIPGNITYVDGNMPGQIITTAAITSYTALSVPAYYRAMVFLSRNMASFPRSVRNKADTVTAHDLDELLSWQPNPSQDAFTFWSTLFFHNAHYNNGYAEIIREKGRKRRPVQLKNLLPEEVIPFRFDRDDGNGERQYYIVGRKRVLTANDVIHLAGLSYDGMFGINPVRLHERTLRRASLIQAYVTRYLERGSIIRGSIELPADMDDDDKINQIVDRIRRYFSGVDGERDIIVLAGGSKLNNAGITPQDSQLVQQGQLTTKEIAMITGVPPQFLYEGAEAKYVNTVEQAGIDVVRFTFRPLIEQAEGQLSLKLLTREERAKGLYVNIDPDALLRGDAKAQADIGLAEVKAGVKTPNEYRRSAGMPKSKDADADKLKISGDTSPKTAAALPPVTEPTPVPTPAE